MVGILSIHLHLKCINTHTQHTVGVIWSRLRKRPDATINGPMERVKTRSLSKYHNFLVFSFENQMEWKRRAARSTRVSSSRYLILFFFSSFFPYFYLFIYFLRLLLLLLASLCFVIVLPPTLHGPN